MLRPFVKGIGWKAALLILLMWSSPWTGTGQAMDYPDTRWHVALDPGHGGDDSGAKGPTDILEKTACLQLARALALELESRYRVTLTRSDDYHVPPRQRVAIANQAKADLYISLHTAASFMHAARGSAIYYHAPSIKPAAEAPENSNTKTHPQRWNRVQTRHQSGSQALAKALKRQLQKLLDKPDVRVVGAPLLPLEGVDMPAVLIELGHITNPATEQWLATSQGRASLAQAILTGIDDYVQSTGATPQP